MCIKFSDKQLKVVSDSISECLFCKNFLGGACPQTPLEGLCFAHQDTTPLPYDHAISEMANQIWFWSAIPSLAIIFPYIVLWSSQSEVIKNIEILKSVVSQSPDHNILKTVNAAVCRSFNLMKVEKPCAMNFTDNAPPTKNIEPQVPF